MGFLSISWTGGKLGIDTDSVAVSLSDFRHEPERVDSEEVVLSLAKSPMRNKGKRSFAVLCSVRCANMKKVGPAHSDSVDGFASESKSECHCKCSVCLFTVNTTGINTVGISVNRKKTRRVKLLRWANRGEGRRGIFHSFSVCKTDKRAALHCLYI